ncbi:MAG: hypothetical protein EAZ57_03845 [Cytophagales bacterium]|nr:MAG: hypothetical protein EAZ67_04860 [Cytophagales bacterium]TAF61344.1 MAG: hypothetical protein EAZ57_03845 [Cytophagales bacterium]
MRFLFVLCFFIGSQLIGIAQPYKSVYHLLRKNAQQAAFTKLQKYENKKGQNAGVDFLFGLVYEDSLSPYFSLSKAYNEFNSSLSTFQSLNKKQIDRLNKLSIDSNLIRSYFCKVDRKIYNNYLKEYKLSNLKIFITNYPESYFYTSALLIRDSLAFLEAQKINSSISYMNYIKDYPESRFKNKSLVLYEDCLFEEKLKFGTIEELTTYLKTNPEVSNKTKIEQTIYKKLTPFYKSTYYQKFIEEFPNHTSSKEATSVLRWLTLAEQSVLNPKAPIQWPFIEGKKIGFLDNTGKVAVKAVFEEVLPSYFCEGNQNPEIVFKELKRGFGLSDRLGQTLIEAQYDSLMPLNAGIIGLQNKDKLWAVAFKSGQLLSDFVFTSLEPLSRYFVAGTRIDTKQKGVFTYDGILLCASDSIVPLDNEKILCLGENIYEIDLAELHRTDGDMAASSIHLGQNMELETIWPEGYLFTEGTRLYKFYLIAEKRWLRWQNITLGRYKNCIKVFDGQHYKLYNLWPEYKESPSFTALRCVDTVAIAQKSGKWYLYDLKTLNPILSRGFDSLVWLGGGVVGKERGNQCFYWSKTDSLCMNGVRSVRLGYCAEGFYLLKENKNKYFDFFLNTQKIALSENYTDAFVANGRFLIVEKDKKRGLLDLRGEVILPCIYDGITVGENNEAHLILFKNNKYGMYLGKEKVLIPPIYESCPQQVSAFYFKAQKKGSWIVLDLLNRPISKQTFESVERWNDSSAMVKVDNMWRIFHFSSKSLDNDIFENQDILCKTDDETVVRTLRYGSFGLMSNKRGRLMPEEYSNIRVLMANGKRIYWADRYLSQAKTYVYIVTNDEGEVLQRQSVDEDYYEKSTCYAE